MSLKNIVFSAAALGITIASPMISAKEPPKAPTLLLNEKFEQWLVTASGYSDGPNGKVFRDITNVPGDNGVSLHLTCQEKTGWALAIGSNSGSGKTGKPASQPGKATLLYHFGSGKAVTLTGSTTQPGKTFSYVPDKAGAQRAPLRAMLQSALQATDDIHLTLPPGREEIILPIAGFSQAVQRFSDACPL